MRSFVTVLLLPLAVMVVATTPGMAQTPSPGQMAQRERMTNCNTDAGARKLTGDVRKTFMSDCLSGKTAAAPEKPLTPQQAKMKSCNADASGKSLKGAERKSFMSSCLKG